MKYEIWNAAGQERIHLLRQRNGCKKDDCKFSLHRIKSRGNPNIVMALDGNTANLEDRRKVTAKVVFFGNPMLYCHLRFFQFVIAWRHCARLPKRGDLFPDLREDLHASLFYSLINPYIKMKSFIVRWNCAEYENDFMMEHDGGNADSRNRSQDMVTLAGEAEPLEVNPYNTSTATNDESDLNFLDNELSDE